MDVKPIPKLTTLKVNASSEGKDQNTKRDPKEKQKKLTKKDETHHVEETTVSETPDNAFSLADLDSEKVVELLATLPHTRPRDASMSFEKNKKKPVPEKTPQKRNLNKAF